MKEKNGEVFTSPFVLRNISLEIRTRINESAKANERSINSEILFQLKKAYLDTYEKNSEVVSERAGKCNEPDSN